MPLFDLPMVPKNGRLRLEDATSGTPIAIEVQYDEGNLEHGEMAAGYQDTEFFRSRGVEFAVVETGEHEGLEATFSAYVTDFGDATEKTLIDACMKTGAFASGVSVFGANRPWGLKATYTQEQTNYGAGADSSLVFAKVRLSYSFAESGAGRIVIRMRIFNPSSTITRA
jgi:hypothetical protein